MDFIVFSVAFLLFVVGLALVGQGFIRKEPPTEIAPLVRYSSTRFVPPPEKHPIRLMLIGLVTMVAAVAIIAVAQ